VSESTATSVTLAWTSIPYVQTDGYYEVSIATEPGGPYIVVGTTASKLTESFIVENLRQNTPYYFMVRTFSLRDPFQSNDLWSEYSEEISVTLGG
jgi:hypothetical protein